MFKILKLRNNNRVVPPEV